MLGTGMLRFNLGQISSIIPCYTVHFFCAPLKHPGYTLSLSIPAYKKEQYPHCGEDQGGGRKGYAVGDEAPTPGQAGGQGQARTRGSPQ